jgi:hypothetical protein
MTTARSHGPRLTAFRPKRLFGQVCDSEGLLGIEIGPNADRLAVLVVAHGAERRLSPCSAALATRADDADRDDSIAEVPDF